MLEPILDEVNRHRVEAGSKPVTEGVLRADIIHVATEIRLGWPDRIRVLFGRTIHHHQDTCVLVIEGDSGVLAGPTQASGHVEPLFPRRRVPLLMQAP